MWGGRFLGLLHRESHSRLVPFTVYIRFLSLAHTLSSPETFPRNLPRLTRMSTDRLLENEMRS